MLGPNRRHTTGQMDFHAPFNNTTATNTSQKFIIFIFFYLRAFVPNSRESSSHVWLSYANALSLTLERNTLLGISAGHCSIIYIQLCHVMLDIAVVLFQLVSVNSEPPWPLDVTCMSPKGVCVGSLVPRVAYDRRLWTFERWGTVELPSKGIEVSHHAPGYFWQEGCCSTQHIWYPCFPSTWLCHCGTFHSHITRGQTHGIIQIRLPQHPPYAWRTYPVKNP